MKTPFVARCPCRAPKNFWISGLHNVLPPLCLDVDEIQAKSILPNHPVDALVAALAQPLRRVVSASAVTHPVEHIEHELLEELRGLVKHSVEELGGEGRAHLAVGCVDPLLWRLLVRPTGRGGVLTTRRGRLGLAKLVELLELRENLEIDSIRILFEHVSPAIGNAVNGPPRTIDQLRPVEVRCRPADSVLERSDTSTRDQFLDVGLREREALREAGPDRLDRVIAAVLKRDQ